MRAWRRRALPGTVVLLLLSIPLAAALPAQASDGDGGFWPGKARWRRAAVGALKDPVTWVPAGGALVVWAGDWDEDLSQWAAESTPIYGSTASARDASDLLRTASHLGMITTALFVHGEDASWSERLERAAVEQAGVLVALSLTSGLKSSTDRERPNRSDRRSFPSGHATQAFAYSAATSRNLAAGDLPAPLRRGLKIGFGTLAAGTAWARVEAGAHFPTDVLVGAALGNFVSRLVTDAFFEQREELTVHLAAGPGQVVVGVHLTF